MPNVKGSIRKRGADGLMPEQSKVIKLLGMTSDWKVACDKAGVAHDKFRSWIRRDPAFREAFERVNAGVVEGVRKQLEASAQKAAEVYDEALDATKDVDLTVECPHCERSFKVTAEVPDFGTRLKAGDAVLRVSKILKDVKEVSGTVTIQDQPLYLQIAFARFKSYGRDAIPPNAYDKLVELGIIKMLGSGEEPVYDAEWEEIDETDTADIE